MILKINFANTVKSFLRYYLIWLVAFILFNVIRRLGNREVVNGEVMDPPEFSQNLLIIVLLPFLLAGLSVLSDRVLSIKRTAHWSYGKVILLHIAMDLVMLILTTMFVYRFLHQIGIESLLPNKDVFRSVFSRNMIIAGVYITIINMLINTFRLINANMGSGNLWKLLIGRYHEPKEEEHVFMFLDLKSSTTAAEQIGHKKYSQMIQECYFDLGVPLQETGGQVYQFVGDEAVIMWSPNKGDYDSRCLKLFYDFDNLLLIKRESYIEKYGWFPQFKAGIHKGQVIATQVGAIKREIAFHGDTLNTTARIQSLCNSKGVKILISEDLKNALMDIHGAHYTFKEEGEEILRGKAQKMKIYSVIEGQ